jgi:LL-diaminopimelate aminotransferase
MALMPSRSRRLDNIPPYLFAEISRLKAEMRARGEDIIDLGIGDPDQPTPEPIVSALQRACADPRTHTYDESPRGWEPFVQSIARWYHRRFGVALDPNSEILELIGSKEGLAHLVWAFVDPGDAVIVPDPSYPVYRTHARMCGATVYEVPLKRENGFLPVLSDIPSEVAQKAKLFFVCYPNNPTGAVANIDFYREVVRFCREYDILLVADMAYSEVTYDGYISPSPLQVENARDVTLEFHSLSKTFNMTGWRIGFACGNRDAVATLAKLKENLDSKQFPAIAEAGAYALEHVSNRQTFALYEKRRDLLVGALQAGGWDVEAPKGSFYVWAPVPTEEPSADFAERLLKESRVLVVPGIGYGEAGEGYVRMSLTVAGDVAGERVAEAGRRIAEATRLITGRRSL